MQRKRTATQLVKEAIPAKSGKRWQDELSTEDRKYVSDVVRELLRNPEAACCLAAKNLIAELQINRSVSTVTHTLREMLRDSQKKA